MSEALKIGASVSTPLGALGLAIIVGLFIYYRRLRHEEIQLGQLPGDDRAHSLDHYLTRYKLDASNLDRRMTYDLIRYELQKRHARVTLTTIIVASVFILCFLVFKLPAPTSTPQVTTAPGDLTAVFGKVGDVNRVRNVPRSENTKLLSEWMAKSQRSIKIATINGSSWIRPNLMNVFRQASDRIDVTLLLLDYTDNLSADLFNDTMAEYGESIWSPTDFKNNFSDYMALLKAPRHHLTLGLYREYPWTRFTLFDDRAVSFIITPTVEAGDSVMTYFSEDRFIVECFTAIFQRIISNARGRGEVFTNYDAAVKFLSNHSADH